MLAGAVLVATAAGAGERPAGTRCLASLHRGFAAVAEARRRTAEHCLHDASGGRGSFAQCVAADARGHVTRIRARATAAAERSCARDGLPAAGAAGVSDAIAAGDAAGLALAEGLFGLAPDPAIAARRERPAMALCQAKVLAQAGRCAATYTREYHRCAERALRAGGGEAELVVCKGADPRGAIARACDAAIAAAAAACDGDDVQALFPGCGGPLADCARGHARRSVGLALNDAGALCEDVEIGGLPPETLLRCFEPPPAERIVRTQVPFPDGVVALSPEWDETGERLIVSFTAPDVIGTQLASVRPDGSGFRCLTCGSAIAGNLRPAQLFADGRRVLVAGPNGPSPRWLVLECSPRVDECRSSALVPIRLPEYPDPGTPIFQYRVPHVTLDDAWFLWTEVRARGPGGVLSAMGRLTRAADAYLVTDARVIAPPLRSLAIGTDTDLWRNFTQPFEAKEAAPRGGLDWVVAGTPSAGHYDNFAIDLTSGAVRPMTSHPDHDEGVRLSPDEQWAVVSSARTDERVEFLGLVPRPPYIDWIAFSTHFVAIAGAPGDGLSPGGSSDERDCYLDPWLLDRWFERGEYLGQRLLMPADGWASTAGGFDWSPDGTRLTLVEQRWRRLLAPGERQSSRVWIASFPNRRPIEPSDAVPAVPTPEPTWAVRYEDWIVPDTRGVTVLPGKASGTATIRNDMASAIEGEIEVTFDDYSDDGRSVLDGYERFRIPQTILQGAEYEVELALRGAHTGSMRGALVYDFVNEVIAGEVVSELDGRVLRGPRTCYEAGLIPLP